MKKAPLRSTESKHLELNFDIRADKINHSLRSYHVYLNGTFIMAIDKATLANNKGLIPALLRQLSPELIEAFINPKN